MVVLKGALIGLALSGMVAVLTFILQRRLPYRKMLIVTGILLGGVLLVMVGEQAQEMQLAHWIGRTEVPALVGIIPPWMGMWFAVFPTYETLAAQALAGAIVVGSYYAARKMTHCSERSDSSGVVESDDVELEEVAEIGSRSRTNSHTPGIASLSPLQIAQVAVRK
jgi:hypothetical protein